MLGAWLDFHRATLLMKIDGVGDGELRRPMTQSGTNLLGMVKHLAYVERWWFQEVFAGRSMDYPWTDEDPDADWRVESHETTGEIVALYRNECDESHAILRENLLDDLARHPGRSDFTLRWIALHMIEETARHNGHADILREMIDGSTGE